HALQRTRLVRRWGALQSRDGVCGFRDASSAPRWCGGWGKGGTVSRVGVGWGKAGTWWRVAACAGVGGSTPGSARAGPNFTLTSVGAGQAARQVDHVDDETSAVALTREHRRAATAHSMCSRPYSISAANWLW